MKKKMVSLAFLLAVLLCVSACGFDGRLAARRSENVSTAANSAKKAEQAQRPDVQSSTGESAPDDAADEQTICMVVKNDMVNYQLTLMNLSDSSEICYEYSDGTEFFDKYGEYTLEDKFSEGKLAAITRLNSNDTLGAVSFTDKTWSYEDIRNYSIDREKNRILIADTVYECAENMKVFSDGVETDLYAIGENDVLNIYGIDRKIYSVVVKSGHGMLALTNTDLFEGGWMNLGTQVYTVVTKDMTMEIPEGIYKFAVANDGYGDDGEVRIRRDQTTTIDLNDYKGEGPKMCRLTFRVDVESAVVRIDGKKIDVSEPLEVRYGVHMLGVRAKGYDDWNRQLVINSPTAKIDILLTEDSGTSQQSDSSAGASDDTDSNKNQSADSPTQSQSRRAGSLAGSMAGSLSGSKSGGDSSTSSGSAASGNNSSSSLANTALSSSLASIITGGDSTDYLDTLANLVKSLDKLNSASSENGD